MVILRASGKLSTEDAQHIIVSVSTVLFRVVKGNDGFKLTTATAHKDTLEFSRFSDQESLVQKNRSVFFERGLETSEKLDLNRTPYIEAYRLRDLNDLVAIANEICSRLGIKDTQALALKETKRIFSDFVANDWDEEAYLCDDSINHKRVGTHRKKESEL